MSNRLDVLITDTGPLITLALADNLSVLTQPKLRIIIPDVVMIEATRFQQMPGVSEIIDFTYRNSDLVTQQATETAHEYRIILANGGRPRNMGERAVAEVAERYSEIHPERDMLLLFEDRDLQKRILNLPSNTYAISTGDFLRTLERARLIQSADRVLVEAQERGRTIERQRTPISPERSIKALDSHLKTMQR